MKEIKFRFWDYGIKQMEMCDFTGGIGYSNYFTRLDGVIMQYTGLKDKNGKEIYEGDILDIIQYEGNGEEITRARNKVRWNEAEAKFDFEWATNGLIGIGGSDLDIFLFNFRGRGKNTMDWYLDFEIIGNIYENPELVKAYK